MSEQLNPAAPAAAVTLEQTAETPKIDYDKIESMISKGQQQKESAILNSYFKQLGMSQEEVQAAAQKFKQDKAQAAVAKDQESEQLKTQLEEAKQQLQAGAVERAALKISGSLGVDAKTLPYLNKLADFSDVFDDKGEIKEDAVKAAMEKVLQDVPGLKPSGQEQTGGFVIGANSNTNEQPNVLQDQLAKAFGNKK